MKYFINFIPIFNHFWNIKILFNLWDERKASCSRYLPQSSPVNEKEMGRSAWKRLLSTKVSVLPKISRKRQSFRSDSSKWKGPLFLPLVSIPPSYIPVFNPRSASAEFFSRLRFEGGKVEAARNQLWNFSNLSVILRFLLCPGSS